MTAFSWIGANGDWTSAADWTPAGGPPSTKDSAILGGTGTYVVSVGTSDNDSAAFVSLSNANATLDILGALNIGTGSSGTGIPGNDSGTLTLSAGTLIIDTSSSGVSSKLRFATVLDQGGTVDFAGGALFNVIWEGTLDLSATNANVHAGIQNTSPGTSESGLAGLEVLNAAGSGPGTVNLTGANSHLIFYDYQTFSNATIEIGASAITSGQGAYLNVGASTNNSSGNGPSSVTLDTTVTVISSGANIYAGIIMNESNDSLVNKGTIQAEASGGLFLASGSITNQGTIAVTNSDQFKITAGTLTNTGTITTDSTSQFLVLGTIAEQGGTIISGTTLFDIGNTGRVSGFGTLTGNFSVGGTMEATGGTLSVSGSTGTIAATTGNLMVDANSTFIVTGGVTVANVTFSGGGPGEVFGFGSQANSTTINQFEASDTIWLTYLTDTGNNVTAAYNAGSLDVMQNGSLVANFALAGTADYADASYFAVTDAHGGTDITTTACYASGTSILTANGEILVENLREGMLAATAAGFAPIVWLGHRQLDCARHPRPADVWPVRVSAGAFGDCRPRRDLLLSPDHAVFEGGVLIPVRHLINNTTITQEQRDHVTYWHVELEAHGVLLAEGLPCESYLDTGNRDAFENHEATALHPSFARGPDQAWSVRAFAALVESGPKLSKTRARLARRAVELGFPARGAVRDLRLHPVGPSVLTVPRGVEAVRLISDKPARLPGDRRLLGALIEAISIDGEPITLEDPRLARGFHEVECHDGKTVRWTAGAATLYLGAATEARRLAVHVAMPGARLARRTAA